MISTNYKQKTKTNFKLAKYFFAIVLTLFTLYGQKVNAATSITRFVNPSWCNSSYPTAYTTGNFSITETSFGNRRGFTPNQTNRTLILGFSNAAFQFNPGVGTITVNNTGVTINSYTITSTAITINISTSGTNNVANTISFTGFQIRATGNATGYIRRTGGTFRIDNATNSPRANTSWGNLTASAPFSFSSASVRQEQNGRNVFPTATNQRILRIAVTITGGCTPLTATSFTLNTAGSTNALNDIANAKLYYTGTRRRFSTTTLFGTTATPNGAFTITGSQSLTAARTYYFWLTYDLTGTATGGNVVDAQATAVVLNGITSTFSGNPGGNRPIVATHYYSIAGTNWNTNGNWSLTSYAGASCGCTPATGALVHINRGIAFNVANRSVTNITVDNGGNLTHTSGNLTVTNLLSTTGNGRFTVNGATLADITTTGTGASSIISSSPISGDVSIGSGTTLTLSAGGHTINGDLDVDGTFALGANNLTLDGAQTAISGLGSITGTGTINLTDSKDIIAGSNLLIAPVMSISNNRTITNAGTIKTTNNITGGGSGATWINDTLSSLEMAGSTSALLTTGVLTATASPNTVIYSGTGAQTVKSASYYNLTINPVSAATKTLGNVITVFNDLTISGAGTLDVSASSHTIDIYNNWINNSSATNPFFYRTGTVNFNDSTTISGTAISAFNHVNILSGAALVGHATIGKFKVAGNWINDGKYYHNSSDVSFIPSGTPGGSNSSTMSGSIITVLNDMNVLTSKTLTLPTELDIDGNLTNDGTLTHNNGKVAFTGLGTAQTFGGTTSSNTLYDFEIDNLAGSVDLLQPITVNDSLIFSNGLITTSAAPITVASTGLTFGQNSTSYVSGMLNRVFPSASGLLFPVGKDGFYRPLTFTYVTLTGTSTVSVEQTESALSGTLPLTAVLNNNRTWDISQTGGSAFTYNVTLDGTGDLISGDVIILKQELGAVTATLATTPNYTNSADYNSLTGTCNFTTGSNCTVSSAAGTDQTGASTCGLTTVTLGASVPVTGVGSWSIIAGTGGSLGNAASETSTLDGTGGTTYLARWTVTDGNCTAGDDVTITLNQNPTTSNANINQNVCTGSFTTLAANAPTIGTGAWSIAGSPSNLTSQFSSLTNRNATFTPAGGLGTYNLTWRISNSPCTSSSDVMNVIVVNTLTPTISILQTSGSNPVCNGSSVTFTASQSGGGPGPIYQWKKNGSNIGGATSSTYSATAGTNFVNGDIITCQLTSNASCRTLTTVVSTGITMTVTPNTVPSVTVALTSGSNPSCAAQTLTFTATPTNGGASPTYDFQINSVSVQNSSSNVFTTSSINEVSVVNVILTSDAVCPSPASIISNDINMFITSSPVITSSASSTNICIGETIDLFSSATTAADSVLIDDFNSATTWTKTNTSTGGTPANAAWTQRPDGFVAGTGGYPATVHSNDASDFFLTDSRAQGNTTTATNTILTSPVFSTVGYSTLNLEFYHFFDWLTGTGNSAAVEVSTNGSSWTPVITYTSNQGLASSFAQENINLDAYVGNATFYVRFHYVSTARAHFWAIDNVNISGTPTHTYSWTSTPSGFTSSTQNPTSVAPIVSTVYNVTATNSFGCSTSATPISVTVNPLVTPSVSIAITSGSQVMCSGSSVTFTPTPVNGGTPIYNWKINGTSSASGTTFTSSSLSDNDIISVDMTSVGACASPSSATSNTITVTIKSTGLWLGITNNWQSGTNWCGGLPTSSTNVEITTGVPFQPTLTAASACNDISIASGASVTLNGQAFTVEGNFSGAGVLVGSPTSDLTINGSGNAGTFNMSSASVSSKTLNNLTLNRTSTGSVTLGDTLYLKTGLTLTDGTLNTADKLRLLSTSTQTASINEVFGTGNVSGNVIAEKFAPGGLTGWANIGNPVDNNSLSSWIDDFPMSGFPGSTGSAGSFISVYHYDETVNGTADNGYIPATNITNTVAIGTGYMVYLGDGYTNTNPINIDVAGPVHIGDFNLPVSHTVSTPTALPDDDGLCLVANPYCSTIDWDNVNWTKTNMGSAIYIYNADAQQFAVYVEGSSGVGTNGGTNLIASSQAFWVRTSSTSPTPVLTAKEAVKSTANTAFLKVDKTLPVGYMKVKVSNSFGSDEALLRINSKATTNFDSRYDATKMYSMKNTVPNIATVLNGVKYSINAFDSLGTVSEIPLEYKAGSNGLATMSFEGISGFTSKLYLKDNLSQTVTPLIADTTLSFAVTNVNEELNRYSLVFDNSITTKLANAQSNEFTMYPNPGTDNLNIMLTNMQEVTSIVIADAIGKTSYNYSTDNRNFISVDTKEFAQGVYFVKVMKGNNCVAINKWIKQ